MKLHFITVGEPKLDYAKRGWDEYYKRLSRYHQLRTTRVSDKNANDTSLLHATGRTYLMPLDLEGKELTSHQLAIHMEMLATNGTPEITFIIGGPEGFGPKVRERADFLWKLSSLTFPHDLAMVVMLEALYRASTIAAGHPYHR